MSVTRRGYLLHLAGWLAAASLPACTSTPSRTSNETVSSVLVSEDGKKLVVMTPQYHYVFDLPPTILSTLKSDFHPVVDGDFKDFHVERGGRVSGEVTLRIAKSHPEAISAALAAGFSNDATGASFTTTLQGERYKAGTVQPTQQYRLNKTYVIPVSGDGDAGPTPIGVVGGTILIGFIVLYVLFHPGWPAH